MLDLNVLQNKFSSSVYQQHIQHLQVQNLANGKLILSCRGNSQEWLENRLRDKILGALQTEDNSIVDIEFVAEESRMAEVEDTPIPTPTRFEGFTPVVDVLANELGLIPTAIYGVVWRYCQMNSRTCYASQAKIADRLGLTRATINRNLKPLLNGGYVRCLNSDSKGETKVYIVTNKVDIEIGFKMSATVN